MEELKAAKLRAGLSPKTINNLLGVLSKCLRTAEEWGELDRVPKTKPLRVPPQRFDFLSIEESDRLIRAVPAYPWDAMVVVALRTGLRIGELIGLEWPDLNLETRILTVRRSIFRNEIVSPKNNRIRHIPLTEQTCRILLPARAPSGPMFSRGGSIRLDDQLARRAMRRLCKQAGLRPIGWHVLRHTFASHLAMAGVSIKVIQELLGHSDVRTTMRYAHLAPSSLHEAVQVLDPKQAADDILGHSVGNTLPVTVFGNAEMPRFVGHS
jgi:integrase